MTQFSLSLELGWWMMMMMITFNYFNYTNSLSSGSFLRNVSARTESGPKCVNKFANWFQRNASYRLFRRFHFFFFAIRSSDLVKNTIFLFKLNFNQTHPEKGANAFSLSAANLLPITQSILADPRKRYSFPLSAMRNFSRNHFNWFCFSFYCSLFNVVFLCLAWRAANGGKGRKISISSPAESKHSTL